MPRTLSSTPQKDGFRMPAEFAQHSGTWMLWPERPDNWRENGAHAQRVFAEVANAIARFEPVSMGVSHDQYSAARNSLAPEVRVVELSNNDSWIRDTGPTCVIHPNGSVRCIRWRFNAWGGMSGGLYYPWDRDELVSLKVSEMERVDSYQAPLILEGGSFHTDGDGTLLTTEECLLNPNRNPELGRSEIESLLVEYLGIHHIIWLKKGVYRDETNGHVDNLGCFTSPGHVLLTWTEDKHDPQYDISCENAEILLQARDAKGRSLELTKVHQPGPLYITAEEAKGVETIPGTYPRLEGDRMAGSYVNFYICNGAAIVPVFNDPMDAQALQIISEQLPGRQIVPVYAREILLGGGNIHCITQQIPIG